MNKGGQTLAFSVSRFLAGPSKWALNNSRRKFRNNFEPRVKLPQVRKVVEDIVWKLKEQDIHLDK